METLFENEFARDEGTAKEIYRYWYFKKPLLVVVYIYLGIYALSCILGFIIDFQSAKESMPIFVMVIFFLSFMLISYRSQVKAMIQRDKEISGGEPLCCKISVTEQQMTLSTLENRTPISIDNLKSAFVTNNYIVVVTKARLMFILKKDGFTLGDCDGFIAFLREKGIKIRGKKN